MKQRIPVGNESGYVPIVNNGFRVGSVHVVPWYDALNAASYFVDAASYMLQDYVRIERIPDWRGNRRGDPARVIERFHLKDDTPRSVRELKVDRENMISIIHTIRHRAVDRHRQTTIADQVLKALAVLSLSAIDLSIKRRTLAEIEAPWRWRDYTCTNPSSQEMLDALTVMLELDDYGAVTRFVAGQVGTL